MSEGKGTNNKLELYEVRIHAFEGSASVYFLSEQSARKYVGIPNKYGSKLYVGKVSDGFGFIEIFEGDQVEIIGSYEGRSKADGRDIVFGISEIELLDYIKRETNYEAL